MENSKTLILQGVTYTNDNLLKSINQRHIEAMERSKLLGVQHAHQNKPQVESDLSALTNSIHADYDTLIAENNDTNQLVLHQKQGSADMAQTKAINNNLRNQIETLTADRNVKIQLLETKESRASYLILALGLLICLFLEFGEVFYIGNSFQVLGGSLFKAYLIGFGVCLSVALFAHFSPIFIKERIPKRWISLAIFIAGSFIVSIFYAVSYFRIYYIQRTDHSVQEISHSTFVLINTLFFLGFCMVMAYMIYPAWEEVKRIRENVKKQDEINKLNNQIKLLENQIKANEEELNRNLKLRMAVMAFAKSTEEKIIRYYQQSIDLYKQVNAENREHIPECLNLPPKPLNLFYNDINI